MHELGVAFVQVDRADRGFLWSLNRLLPSHEGRSLSQSLLRSFRELCEQLEINDVIAAEQNADVWDWSADRVRTAGKHETTAQSGGVPGPRLSQGQRCNH